MEINLETIAAITTRFVQTALKFGTAEDLMELLKGGAVGLRRTEDGWELVAIKKRENRQNGFVTHVDIPEELCEEISPDDFTILLTATIAAKLGTSKAMINANARRSPEARKKASEIANQAKKKS